jgi:hypothetical protein
VVPELVGHKVAHLKRLVILKAKVINLFGYKMEKKSIFFLLQT